MRSTTPPRRRRCRRSRRPQGDRGGMDPRLLSRPLSGPDRPPMSPGSYQALPKGRQRRGLTTGRCRGRSNLCFDAMAIHRGNHCFQRGSARCGDPKAAESQVHTGGGLTARKADGHLTMVTQHYDDNQHRQYEYRFKFVADGYVVFNACQRREQAEVRLRPRQGPRTRSRSLNRKAVLRQNQGELAPWGDNLRVAVGYNLSHNP
jgi:hypothetical protein